MFGGAIAGEFGGGHLCIVASVCGTSEDAQGADGQMGMLRDAGVLVYPSNAQAAHFSLEVVRLLAGRLAGRKEKG